MEDKINIDWYSGIYWYNHTNLYWYGGIIGDRALYRYTTIPYQKMTINERT